MSAGPSGISTPTQDPEPVIVCLPTVTNTLRDETERMDDGKRVLVEKRNRHLRNQVKSLQEKLKKTRTQLFSSRRKGKIDK